MLLKVFKNLALFILTNLNFIFLHDLNFKEMIYQNISKNLRKFLFPKTML